MEQLNLFNLNFLQKDSKITPVVTSQTEPATVTKEKKVTTKKAMPQKMVNFNKQLKLIDTGNIAGMMDLLYSYFGTIGFNVSGRTYYTRRLYQTKILGERLVVDMSPCDIVLNVSEDKYHTYIFKVLSIIDKTPYLLKITLTCNGYFEMKDSCSRTNFPMVQSIQVTNWREYHRLEYFSNLFDADININRDFPYAKDFLSCYPLVRHNPYILYLSPQLEQLWKAGYKFINTICESFAYPERNTGRFEIFNRLTQPGTNMKTIFKTKKYIYNMLKHEKNLSTWDMYRKLGNNDNIPANTIQQFYDGGFADDEIERMRQILGKKYEEKYVFTITTLTNYLNRLDVYEAIERREALMLINDYLDMCTQLKMRPRIDGDSLKREHDIAARLCRQRRNEIMAEKMTAACENMKKYNYEEGVFFIRGIESYDDLIDEATQQHNCVASYADRIASHKTMVYVMRMKSSPEKSLITVEIDMKGHAIRQKFMAYNQPIRNKAQTEFLERWLKYVHAQNKAQKAA